MSSNVVPFPSAVDGLETFLDALDEMIRLAGQHRSDGVEPDAPAMSIVFARRAMQLSGPAREGFERFAGLWIAMTIANGGPLPFYPSFDGVEIHGA